MRTSARLKILGIFRCIKIFTELDIPAKTAYSVKARPPSIFGKTLHLSTQIKQTSKLISLYSPLLVAYLSHKAYMEVVKLTKFDAGSGIMPKITYAIKR